MSNTHMTAELEGVSFLDFKDTPLWKRYIYPGRHHKLSLYKKIKLMALMLWTPIF